MNEPIRCAAVISPAGRPEKTDLDCGIGLLRTHGLEVKVMPHVYGSENSSFPYLAATDAERAMDFMQAYCDNDVDIIFASRGGYGCARMLPYLDWSKLKSCRPKIVAGYSDLTSLFFAMTVKNCGIPLASVMAAKLMDAPENYLSSVMAACSGKERIFELDVIKYGCCNGTVLAANLTVAASCAGTAYMPDTSGKILVLEEVGEDLYRIDRMLNQLRLCGALEKCSGLVGGYFSGCDTGQVKELLKTYSRYVNGPVLAGFSYGHELPFVPFLYGNSWKIDGNCLVIS